MIAKLNVCTLTLLKSISDTLSISINSADAVNVMLIAHGTLRSPWSVLFRFASRAVCDQIFLGKRYFGVLKASALDSIFGDFMVHLKYNHFTLGYFNSLLNVSTNYNQKYFYESYLLENNTFLFTFSEVIPFDVLKAIKLCKSDSKGADGLSNSYFKRGIEVSIPHLIEILNLSLISSTLILYIISSWSKLKISG